MPKNDDDTVLLERIIFSQQILLLLFCFSGLAISLWIGPRASHTHVRQGNLARSPGEYLSY